MTQKQRVLLELEKAKKQLEKPMKVKFGRQDRDQLAKLLDQLIISEMHYVEKEITPTETSNPLSGVGEPLSKIPTIEEKEITPTDTDNPLPGFGETFSKRSEMYLETIQERRERWRNLTKEKEITPTESGVGEPLSKIPTIEEKEITPTETDNPLPRFEENHSRRLRLKELLEEARTSFQFNYRDPFYIERNLGLDGTLPTLPIRLHFLDIEDKLQRGLNAPIVFETQNRVALFDTCASIGVIAEEYAYARCLTVCEVDNGIRWILVDVQISGQSYSLLTYSGTTTYLPAVRFRIEPANTLPNNQPVVLLGILILFNYWIIDQFHLGSVILLSISMGVFRSTVIGIEEQTRL